MGLRARVAALALAASVAATACSTLLSAEPTPVPGAAATLTRSIRTPIPTPVRTPAASPGAFASPSPRLAVAVASPSASPLSAQRVVDDADIAQVQRRIEQTLASPDLPELESLLLDHIALSTPEGGSVLDRDQAAVWLRDHAGPGIKLTRVERGTQTVMLQAFTDGWPNKDPIAQGQISFSLRPYDANGRPNEEGGGAWQIDVIEAD